MQVFLPEPTYPRCAEVLDTKRLVKQLLEGRQIMTVLAGESPSNAWRNHPAVKMFAGYEHDLYFYLKAIRNEMRNRGYKWENNWAVIQDTYKRNFAFTPYERPYWMEDDSMFERVIITHRGRLWEKNREEYPQYETEGDMYMDYVCCPDRCTYFWATHVGQEAVAV